MIYSKNGRNTIIKVFLPGLFLVIALATAALVAAAISINLRVLYFEYFCNHK